MPSDGNNGKSKFSELFLSVIIAAITGLFITSSIVPAIVQPLLLDGSLISNGRFAFVYDAYDTIEDDDVPSIVGIGSSILMAGMNGTCMQEQSTIENARFYNMAMSGGKPYSEMLQIPTLIESKPDIVMVEIGPNSLYGWDSTQYVNGITDYNEFRFQLMSMGMETNQIGDWYNVLDPVDKQWIETNRFGRLDAWSEYTRDAIEEYLIREIDDLTNAFDETSYSYVPPVGTDDWDNYLSEPNWRTSKFDTKSSIEIREYLDEKMPSKSKQGVYNPKSNNTQNHNALDYMINSLVNASIKVVLVGIPHHPWVNEYLEHGQLDGMNVTYQRYESLEDVYPLQMYWEEWPSEAFSDRNHLDADGREVFCNRVTPVIDAVYFNNNPSTVEILPEMFNITDQRAECSGSNELFIFDEEILEIEAENYSVCSFSEVEIDSFWRINSDFNDYSGQGYISALPDAQINMKDTVAGPSIGYFISVTSPGIYHTWIRMSSPNEGGDSIHVSLDKVVLTYGGVGFTTASNEDWNWERIDINFSSDNTSLLEIHMREDGVRIDSIIITNDVDFSPKIIQFDNEVEQCMGSNELYLFEDENLLIEAEQYSFCEFGKEGIDSIWEIESSFTNYSGEGYLAALPDDGNNAFDTTNGPIVGYNITIQTNETHYVWVRFAATNGGGDSIHLGLNGNPLTYGGVGFGAPDNNAWNWKKIEVNITSIGNNSIEVWMREDGVMIDSILITTDLSYDPRKVSN